MNTHLLSEIIQYTLTLAVTEPTLERSLGILGRILQVCKEWQRLIFSSYNTSISPLHQIFSQLKGLEELKEPNDLYYARHIFTRQLPQEIYNELRSYQNTHDTTQKFLTAVLNDYVTALPAEGIDIYKPCHFFHYNTRRTSTICLEIIEKSKSDKFLERILKIPSLTGIKQPHFPNLPVEFSANLLELSIACSAPIDLLMKDSRVFDPITKTSPLFTQNSFKKIFEIVKSRESEMCTFDDFSLWSLLKSINPVPVSPDWIYLLATACTEDKVDPQTVPLLRQAILIIPKNFVNQLLQYAVHKPYFKDLCNLYKRRFGQMDNGLIVELLGQCFVKGWKNWETTGENIKSLVGSFDRDTDLKIWELALSGDSRISQSAEYLSLLLDLDTVPEFELDLLTEFVVEDFDDAKSFFIKLLKKENYPWRNDIIDFLCTPSDPNDIDTESFGGLDFLKDSIKLQEIITQIVGKEFLTQNIESLSEFYYELLSSDDESDLDSSEIDEWSGNLLM